MSEMLPSDPPDVEALPRPRRRVVGLEARQRRQKLVRYTLLFVSAVFMVNALVGDNGLLVSIKARRAYDAAERKLAAQRYDNQQKLDELRRLKSDPTAIEEEARRHLNLIRPGETLVIVK